MRANDITSKQNIVIALLASGLSIAETARRAKCSEATIYRWLHFPHISAAIEEAKKSALQSTQEMIAARYEALAEQAMQALERVLNDPVTPAAALIKAHQIIVERLAPASASPQVEEQRSSYIAPELIAVMTTQEQDIVQKILSEAEQRLDEKVTPMRKAM